MSSLPLESPPQKHALSGVDRTSSKGGPDMELIWLAGPYINHGQVPPPKGAEVFTMAAVMLKPQSKGTIRLKSSDPFDAPAIDPK